MFIKNRLSDSSLSNFKLSFDFSSSPTLNQLSETNISSLGLKKKERKRELMSR